MGGTGLGVCLLLTLAAPPQPAPKPAAPDPALDREANTFALLLADLADRVAAGYLREVKPHQLLAAGLAELYEKNGAKLPAHLTNALAAAGPGDRLRLVVEARVALGRVEGLTAARAFVTAANGFARATDPYSGLVWQRAGGFAVSDAEFGLGFEVEGATGPRWIAYMLESGRGAAGTEAVPPAAAPWEVRRVIPGSPAAKAGLRPGDVITHLDGDAVTARSNALLFRRLAAVANPDLRDPAEAVDVSKPVVLGVRRAGADGPLELKLPRAGYTPESVFGVARRENGTWDWMLDREARIGYVRLGAVEQDGTTAAFERALTELVADGAEGLVLDLRWCPGGYVGPLVRVVGDLLPPGKRIATIQKRSATSEYHAEPPPDTEAWRKLPLAILVNGETVGGGELIAAALQDHGRGVVVGQRTFGKANIMDLIDAPFPGLGYRYSTGYSLRPDGRNRHRFPDSKPTDDWGVRPDRGYEVPVTPDLSAKLREEADRLATRPAGSTKAVPFDDPLADPQKMIAVRLLRERIKSGGAKKPTESSCGAAEELSGGSSGTTDLTQCLTRDRPAVRLAGRRPARLNRSQATALGC